MVLSPAGDYAHGPMTDLSLVAREGPCSQVNINRSPRSDGKELAAGLEIVEGRLKLPLGPWVKANYFNIRKCGAVAGNRTRDGRLTTDTHKLDSLSKKRIGERAFY